MNIPIMHCFDDNYVIPAGVAFYSLLDNASKEHDYIIYVVHNSISEINQKKLRSVVEGFSNATIEFKVVKDEFDTLFNNVELQTHYTKEMFYKFLAPSLFSSYEKIIVSDVDVVYLNDISREFLDFNVNQEYFLAASLNFMPRNSWLEENQKKYLMDFTEAEVSSLRFGAGYYIFNVKKLALGCYEERFIDFAVKNIKRLRQPEQDVINLVCQNKIKSLAPNSMVCSYLYDIYKNEALYADDLNYSASEVEFALNNPVQLHYATGVKPWNTPASTKSKAWFDYLFKTPFYEDYFNQITPKLKFADSKTLMSFSIPFSKRNKIVVKKIRT